MALLHLSPEFLVHAYAGTSSCLPATPAQREHVFRNDLGVSVSRDSGIDSERDDHETAFHSNEPRLDNMVNAGM